MYINKIFIHIKQISINVHPVCFIAVLSFGSKSHIPKPELRQAF